MYKDAIKEVATDIKKNIGAKDAHDAKRKIVKVTATFAVLASLAAGMLFSSVGDITPELKQESINQPPIVMDIDEFGNTTVDDDDEDADEKKGGVGIVARFKRAVLSLPVAVRLLIITPLWAIGTAIMTVVSILGRAIAASPIGAFIMSAAVGFGILLVLFATTAKVIFPDVPLGKILTKSHVTTLLIIALGLAGADAVAPLFWAKYPLVSGAVKLGVSATIIAILCNRVKRVSYKLQSQLRIG